MSRDATSDKNLTKLGYGQPQRSQIQSELRVIRAHTSNPAHLEHLKHLMVPFPLRVVPCIFFRETISTDAYCSKSE
jgi:hypothetical protein